MEPLQHNVGPLDRLLVVGAGAMGSQIAMLGALGGLTVSLVDIDADSLTRAEKSLRGRVDRMVAKGRLSAAEADASFGRLTFTTALEEGARDADVVIEAIAEVADLKKDLFRRLDELTPAHCVLASNSSSVVPSLLAAATERPSQVCNMHFFNPPLVMECVEVVAHDGVAEETLQLADELARRMGRMPVRLDRETPGFVANRLLNALFREAVALYEGGYASPEAVDTIVRTALRHPMGPFELLDMAGIDVNYQMQMSLFEQTGDESLKPQPTITEKVARNELGRKTGQGFYSYAENGAA